MKLSELIGLINDIQIYRDGYFNSFGFVNMNDISEMMVFIKDIKFISGIKDNSNIASVITTKEIADCIENDHVGIIISDNPERLFYSIHNYLYKETDFYKGNDKKTITGKNCIIGKGAVVADKNVEIGDNVIIEPNAVIFEGTKIGNNCVIGSNSSIGTRGFQFYRENDEAFYIEHVGGVIIEDNVEIMSGTCVASGLIRPTRIRKCAKLDNLVHVGHSADIGERTLVTAGAVIGGSSKIGKRVWIGINSVLKAEVKIGDDAFICMGAVVTKDVEANQKVSGNFAVEHYKQVKMTKKIADMEI